MHFAMNKSDSKREHIRIKSASGNRRVLCLGVFAAVQLGVVPNLIKHIAFGWRTESPIKKNARETEDDRH